MSDDVIARKGVLRASLKQLRRDMGAEGRRAVDATIERRVLALPAFARADVLLTYLGFGAEVRTRGIIEAAWNAGKVVALPRCVRETHEMRWYRVSSFDQLVRSELGMEEPMGDPEYEVRVDSGVRMLALVPGLAFDERGQRLGYGGGYYDRFLAHFAGVTAGLCREEQLCVDLRAKGVVEPHDVPVQLVVSEARVLEVGEGTAS